MKDYKIPFYNVYYSSLKSTNFNSFSSKNSAVLYCPLFHYLHICCRWWIHNICRHSIDDFARIIDVDAVISCLTLCMVDIGKFVIPSRGFVGIQGCIHHICRSNYIPGTIDVCRCMYFFLTCWWRTLTYYIYYICHCIRTNFDIQWHIHSFWQLMKQWCILFLQLVKYYLDQKVPGIQKIQNTSFIHQKWYCPFQSTPHWLQRTYASAWSISRNISGTIVGIAIRAVFDFSIISFRLLKCIPRMVFWLDRTEKNRRELYQVNSMAVGWYSFRSWLKIHG